MCVPDPTGQLKQGECAFRVGVQPQFNGKVILARHPIYYSTCIRTAKAVMNKDLNYHPNVLFLPITGDRAEAEGQGQCQRGQV